MRVARLPVVAAIAIAISACGPAYQAPPADESVQFADSVDQSKILSGAFPPAFKADLVTPAGISVETNGQYKSEAVRKAAAATIDRYWNLVRQCAVEKFQARDATVADTLIPQFPGRLAVEIAGDWKVVEGPTTHHRMQAFPSRARPGSWSSARRAEDSLYIVVVPELIGLGPQMAGALGQWIAANGHAGGPEVAAGCAAVACIRFDYANAPSQAWDECTD
jgi:hypothetical protein